MTADKARTLGWAQHEGGIDLSESEKRLPGEYLHSQTEAAIHSITGSHHRKEVGTER